MMKQLEKYFLLNERKSRWHVEIIAGLSTYLSLSYIFVVNPAILHDAGLNTSAVLFATVVASGVATIAMGMWAKLPFAVAPGLEMNGFFAYAVVRSGSLPLPQALGAVFWSGLLVIAFTRLPILGKIVDSIPSGLKTNISFSVGVFVATIGLHLAKIVLFDVNGIPAFSGWAVSNLTSAEAIILYVGLVVSSLLGLKRLRFPGGMLTSIIVSAVLAKFLGIESPQATGFSDKMISSVGLADFLSGFSNFQFYTIVIILFVINFIGGIGKFIGLTRATNLQVNGQLQNLDRASYVDGGGTVLGAVTGTSSLITYVESAVGIAAGGRTGVTALVCGMLMLGSILLAPLVGLVPVVSTAGVLVYAGWLLLPVADVRNRDNGFATFDIGCALVMGSLSFATFGLDKAMLAGFVLYSGKELYDNRGRANVFLIVTTLLLMLSVLVQYYHRGNLVFSG
jgi:AGZA family xanthine/uracil permease-like MFS transporter